MSLDLNPQLLETLHAQPDTTTNPILHALLSRINPNMGGALPSTQELLSQLESTDPTVGLIAKYLIARQTSESETNSEEEAEGEEDVRVADEQRLAFEQSERLAQIVQRLEWQVQKMRAELDRLRERNDILAAALGACYLCWGEDSNCPVCHGTGRTGTLMPDRELFAQIIAPTIHLFQSTREVNPNNSKNRQSNVFTQDLIPRKESKNE